jgi:hypothetical protein
MTPEEEMQAWTVAYSIAGAVLLFKDPIAGELIDGLASSYADHAVKTLKLKERQLLPRKP